MWNPGDGSDTIEGGAGTDTLQFNGSNVSEKIDISANGRPSAGCSAMSATITMDLNSMEQIDIAALGRRRHHHGRGSHRDRRQAGRDRSERARRAAAPATGGRHGDRHRHQGGDTISITAARTARRSSTASPRKMKINGARTASPTRWSSTASAATTPSTRSFLSANWINV